MKTTLTSLIAATVAAASAAAQCVAPSTFQTTAQFFGDAVIGSPVLDPGPVSVFDLDVTAGVTITQLGLNFLNDGVFNHPNLIGTTARIEMWVVDTTNGLNGGTVVANLPRSYSITNSTPPGAPWTLAASGTFTVAAPDVPSTTNGFSVHLNPGSYGVALVTVPNGTAPGTIAPSTSRLHPLVSNVGLGSPLLVARDQVFTFTSRGMSALGFNAQFPGLMPILRMQYALDPNTAYTTPYGVGCYDQSRTFYQSFAGPANPAGAAPAITTVAPHMLLVPGSVPVIQYLVQRGTGTYPLIAPGSTNYYNTLPPTLGTATHVNTGTPAVTYFGGWDDATSVLYPLPFPLFHPGGSATAISICSNGSVFLDRTDGTLGFWNQYSQFCSGPACFAVGFCDLWPSAGGLLGGVGEIWADSDGSSYVAVTWQNCQEFPNTANSTFGNSFQIVFRSTGVVEYAWGNLRSSDSAPLLIGYTPGGGPDPGSNLPSPRALPDLAVVVPSGYLSGRGNIAPILASSRRPEVGRGLTLVTTNVDPSVVVGLTMISSGSLPGIDLARVGMSGCSLHITFPELVNALAANIGGSISTNMTGTGVIPASAAGLDLYAQTACLSTRTPALNALNVIVSQGLCLHVEIH